MGRDIKMVIKKIQFFIITMLALVTVISLSACMGAAKPAPGTSFSGTIDMGSKASSAEISFKISDNGTSIEDLNTAINQLKLDGLTAGQVFDYHGGFLTSIEDGKFSASIPVVGGSVKNYNLDKSPSEFQTVTDLNDIGKIEGKFLSATKASGTIKIYMWLLLTDYAVEVGEFSWEAEYSDQ